MQFQFIFTSIEDPIDYDTEIYSEKLALDREMDVNPPEDGAYISGLYFEGCSWDYQSGNITEQNSKELYSKVPIILLKPYEQTKRDDDSDTNKNTNVYENASYRESVMPTGKAAGSSIAGVSEKSAFGNVSIVQKNQ